LIGAVNDELAKRTINLLNRANVSATYTTMSAREKNFEITKMHSYGRARSTPPPETITWIFKTQ